MEGVKRRKNKIVVAWAERRKKDLIAVWAERRKKTQAWLWIYEVAFELVRPCWIATSTNWLWNASFGLWRKLLLLRFPLILCEKDP